MKIKLKHSIILLVVIILVHIVARLTGLYQEPVWIDIPQHILAGIFFGLIWIYFSQDQKLSKFISFTSIITFSVFGGFIWELLEFLFWTLAPNYALSLGWVSPTVSDTLSDLASNFIGSLLISIIKMRDIK